MLTCSAIATSSRDPKGLAALWPEDKLMAVGTELAAPARDLDAASAPSPL